MSATGLLSGGPAQLFLESFVTLFVIMEGNVAMAPLGTPLLAGPGAIVATMVFVGRIAGLLISAIAVQLVADAIRAFIAGEG